MGTGSLKADVCARDKRLLRQFARLPPARDCTACVCTPAWHLHLGVQSAEPSTRGKNQTIYRGRRATKGRKEERDGARTAPVAVVGALLAIFAVVGNGRVDQAARAVNAAPVPVRRGPVARAGPGACGPVVAHAVVGALRRRAARALTAAICAEVSVLACANPRPGRAVVAGAVAAARGSGPAGADAGAASLRIGQRGAIATCTGWCAGSSGFAGGT